MSKEKSLKPSFVRGSVRRDGTAVSAHMSHRERTDETENVLVDDSFVGGVSVGLAGVADEPTWWPSVEEWYQSIESADREDVSFVNDAFRPDGSLDVGKRYILAVVGHEFTYLDDDVATVEVEERFGSLDGREKYRMPVPEGAGVEYETVVEALRRVSSQEFDGHIKNGLYKNVKIKSVFLQEYEVVDGGGDPDSVWRLRKEMWEDGSIEHEI